MSQYLPKYFGYGCISNVNYNQLCPNWIAYQDVLLENVEVKDDGISLTSHPKRFQLIECMIELLTDVGTFSQNPITLDRNANGKIILHYNQITQIFRKNICEKINYEIILRIRYIENIQSIQYKTKWSLPSPKIEIPWQSLFTCFELLDNEKYSKKMEFTIPIDNILQINYKLKINQLENDIKHIKSIKDIQNIFDEVHHLITESKADELTDNLSKEFKIQQTTLKKMESTLKDFNQNLEITKGEIEKLYETYQNMYQNRSNLIIKMQDIRNKINEINNHFVSNEYQKINYNEKTRIANKLKDVICKAKENYKCWTDEDFCNWLYYECKQININLNKKSILLQLRKYYPQFCGAFISLIKLDLIGIDISIKENIQIIIKELIGDCCYTCKDNKKDAVCIPCGHCYLCFQCAQDMNLPKCKKCNVQVKQFIQIKG